jgi:tyrosyl-tRNA synthetase
MLKLAARFTVARMLERDDFEKRFKAEKPISIHEFMYPLLQAYDSVFLKADAELGGSDQKFNLLVGRHLQQSYSQQPQIVLTVPLLVGLDGVNKMSKSLGNYVGITEPPNEMFGKIMSITDELMLNYYLLLSDKSSAEISKLTEAVKHGTTSPMVAKKELACEIVARFHGQADAQDALVQFEKVFSRRELPSEMTEYKFDKDEELVDIIVRIGFASSRNEARRLAEQGGISLDSEKVGNLAIKLSQDDNYILKVGKRKFAKLNRKGDNNGNSKTV